VRAAFAKTLAELAERDPRILLLTGDLGYMALEPFAEKFPERFFNMGVAEQNMVGVATGLAEAGFIPFVYSIVPFAVLRPYEFIRNGPIQHRLPVRIVGIGGGMEYGTNGLSHYGLEDVAVLRAQPEITIIAPADHQQTRTALLATWDRPGPIYYRLGKDDKTTVAGLDGRFAPDELQRIGDGRDLLLIAMGNVAAEASAAQRALADRGVACSLAVLANVSPAPIDDLARLLASFPAVVTAEAHYTVGGLGSLVAEVIAERKLGCQLVRCGVQTSPDGVTGSQAFLYQRHGLSVDSLVATGLATVREIR
jgi:transketolase